MSENKNGRSWSVVSRHKEYQKAKKKKDSLVENKESDYKIRRYHDRESGDSFIVKSRVKEEYIKEKKVSRKKKKKD